MDPNIEYIEEKKLVGRRMTLSLAENKTAMLWKNFMPHRHEIPHRVDTLLYSLQSYDANHFDDISPSREFIKWACVEVSEFDPLPHQMEPYILPGGLYAVFAYKGLNTDPSIFIYIFNTWLPQSDYRLDDRPHFEILGAHYKNDDPASEETIYIPIRPK